MNRSFLSVFAPTVRRTDLARNFRHARRIVVDIHFDIPDDNPEE